MRAIDRLLQRWRLPQLSWERGLTPVAALLLPQIQRGSPAAIAAVVRLFVLFLVASSAVVATFGSDLRFAIERQISHPVLFALRGLVGTPPLDPRLKIFAFDDRTAAHENDFDLNLESWADVLVSLDRRGPALIIIDKLFDRKYAASDMAEFVRRVKTLKTPVAAISYVVPQVIEFREQMKELPGTVTAPADLPRWLAQEKVAAYGASPQIAAAFSSLGHAIYDGDGFTRMLFHLGDGRLLQHASLAAAQTVEIRDSTLVIDGRIVPTDDRGKTMVDFREKASYLKRSYSMLALIDRARRQGDVPVVNSGNYVVLLPAMYTGNTDWRESPFGPVPGGYVITSVIDSLLTGKWLRNFDAMAPWTLLFLLIIAALGCRLALRYLFPALGLLLVLGLGLVGLAFCRFGVAFEWFMPTACATLVGGGAALIRAQADQLVKIRMAVELETATLVQTALIPASIHQDEKIRLSAFIQSASECGGDWWSHFRAADGRTFVLIGDAVGHGVSAAIVTAVAYTVRTTFAEGPAAALSAEAILRCIHAALLRMNSKMAIMTFQVVVFDWQAKTLEIANAGHPAPFLVPRSATDDRLSSPKMRLAQLKRPGSALGHELSPNASLKVELREGDRLVLHSDGLYENERAPGQAFGLRRLRQVLTDHANDSATPLRDATMAAFHDFVGDHPPGDDTTLVIAEVL